MRCWLDVDGTLKKGGCAPIADGLIRNARDMQHILMAEEKKLSAQESVDTADLDMPMISFQPSTVPAYRLAQRSKTDEAPFVGMPHDGARCLCHIDHGH